VSGNVEDEARARLDVAQLYEDMGQIPKAVRYYLEAAQIYKEGGVAVRHRELCNKILRLDPDNVQAKAELGAAAAAAGIELPAEAAPAPAPSGAASGEGQPAAARKPASGNQLPPLQLPQPQPGKVLVPTPWLFRDPRYVKEAKKQVPTPVERSRLPFDPLPQVDPQMVMIKQEARKKAEEEAARKANPRVGSAFSGDRPSAFTSGIAKPAGGFGMASSAGAAAANTNPGNPAPQAPPRPAALGGGRSGNQDLADQIRRRLQERGG